MIPSDFNIIYNQLLNKKTLVAEYAVGDLVLKIDDRIQTRVESSVYVVDAKTPSSSCASGQEVTAHTVDAAAGLGRHFTGFCASWYWPLKYLVGPVPDTNYDAWNKPHIVDGLVTRMANRMLPNHYPEVGKVLRVKRVIDTMLWSLRSITLDLMEIPSGVSYNDVGAGVFWPLAELGDSETVKVRDPRFPHDCPSCRAPAYVGAYGAECSAACGIWIKKA